MDSEAAIKTDKLSKVNERLQGILDRHTSRKVGGLMTSYGSKSWKESECQCEDCNSAKKSMKILSEIKGDDENRAALEVAKK